MAIRVCVYVDGLNLYHNSPSGRQECNVVTLAERFLQSRDCLQSVNYYTASPWHLGAARQKTHTEYTAALKNAGARVVLGRFKRKSIPLNPDNLAPAPPSGWKERRYCYHTVEEKETDVNIAIDMVCDAFQDRYDKAMLISGDSDLLPPIRRINALFPRKRLVILAPPSQYLAEAQQLVRQPQFQKNLRLMRIKPKHIQMAALPPR